MLNFQNLLVHIIGLVIYCYPKNHIQVVYLFSSSNFKTKTNYKCSDENYFSLLFQFSNGKFLGIMYAIFAKQMKTTLIGLLIVPFHMNFGKNSKSNEGNGYQHQSYLETYSNWI